MLSAALSCSVHYISFLRDVIILTGIHNLYWNFGILQIGKSKQDSFMALEAQTPPF